MIEIKSGRMMTRMMVMVILMMLIGDDIDDHGDDEEDICQEQAVVGLMEWRFQVAISAPQRHTCYKHARH